MEERVMTHEMAMAIAMCDVCGDDIVAGRCACSHFAGDGKCEPRRDRVYVVLNPLDFDPEVVTEVFTVLRPFVRLGEVQLEHSRVPVFGPALEPGVRVAAHRPKSQEFRLWDPADAWAEGEGSP